LPGADETAARAAAMGLKSVAAPLFEVKPVGWEAPDPSHFDALLLTSANAPRHGGRELADLASLPCYCVGEATAAEARKAGFASAYAGPSDGDAVLRIMADRGARKVLHLSGLDRMPLEHPHISMSRLIVYAAEPVHRLPDDAGEALRSGALVLLHSPRAGRVFSGFVDIEGWDRSTIRIAAISEAAADAAGRGWDRRAVAAVPRDQALLELAAKLCNIDGVSGTGLAR
jgi:uroporphyrinogen-III synthase